MSTGVSIGNNNALVPPIYEKIPLSQLLEAAIQKTYHELYTMADVLGSKSCLERKIELVNFAFHSRQLFIRILAVVKWAVTTGKVTTCEDIQYFLETRARLIRETSDTLAQLARETLLGARVPSFPVTDTIDALTLGSVNFLPKRISEQTISHTTVTENERQQILPRLHQLLTARLSTSDLPIEFTDIIIKNGLVTLRVDGEFEVKLGILDDKFTSPWRIYHTKLFLRDPEEPEQDLIHSYQMQYLTNFIQTLLNDSEKPFVDLYQYLHYYCQSLRLQILFEQAHRIRDHRTTKKDIIISNYIPCKSFTLEYWKDYSTNVNNSQFKKQVIQGKNSDIGMTIICDNNGKFHIQHWPPLPVDDSVEILQIFKKPIFTMEEILNRSIYARCQRRFEELKETILQTITTNIEIIPSIPALKCQLLPESTFEETLFISINPFSGLYKVISYMEMNLCQKIEYSLNRDQTNLIETINTFKIWLIQQRIPSILAHLNCRIYTRIPSINIKNDLIQQFVNNSVFIELIYNKGFYIIVHISDVNQLLIQYYLLIVEKRSSEHELLIVQQQKLNSNQPTVPSNDEGAKWILEPILVHPLDLTMFLKKEIFEFQQTFDNEFKQAQSISILSLKSLLKFINYYDEMLSFLFLKDDFQRRKTMYKSILYCPWTGIPHIDIIRIIVDENFSSSNSKLLNYINERFWPSIYSCTVRLIHTSRDHKIIERNWILNLNLFSNNYFDNSFIETPYNSHIVCTNLSMKTYTKIGDFIHNKLRSAFELTYLFEDYSLALLSLYDLNMISKINSFEFFHSTIRYGPNLDFLVKLTYESNTNTDGTFELNFITLNNRFLITGHQILNRKLILFLNQMKSLKQFIRLLYMTAVPVSSIGRLNFFNRPIFYANQGNCSQFLLTFIPYTESRWRLMFAQIFAIDIQICGPNLILVRDGSFSVQLNNQLNEFSPIPRFKEFLSAYADDKGLTYEFSDINHCFREDDFPVPNLQAPLPSSFTSLLKPETIEDSSFDISDSDTMPQSPSQIYDAIFRDSTPIISSTTTSSNIQSDNDGNQQLSILHSYNRELLTKKNYPVYMTQQTFFQMLYTSSKYQWSRLESYLVSSLLVRQFAKGVNEPLDTNNITIRSVPNEQDTYLVEPLSLQISFIFDIPTAMYRMSLSSLSDSQQTKVYWSNEEIRAMEIFFNQNFFPISSSANLIMPSVDIASLHCVQNLATCMGSFQRILSVINPRIFKDLVKIIRLEHNLENHYLWRVRWCFTIPYGQGYSPAAHTAIYYNSPRQSFLFMFQFISRNENEQNRISFIVPLLHDVNTNQTTLHDPAHKQFSIGNEIRYQAINTILQTIKETINKNECSLYPVILELITRLQIPTPSVTHSS